MDITAEMSSAQLEMGDCGSCRGDMVSRTELLTIHRRAEYGRKEDAFPAGWRQGWQDGLVCNVTKAGGQKEEPAHSGKETQEDRESTRRWTQGFEQQTGVSFKARKLSSCNIYNKIGKAGYKILSGFAAVCVWQDKCTKKNNRKATHSWATVTALEGISLFPSLPEFPPGMGTSSSCHSAPAFSLHLLGSGARDAKGTNESWTELSLQEAGPFSPVLISVTLPGKHLCQARQTGSGHRLWLWPPHLLVHSLLCAESPH